MLGWPSLPLFLCDRCLADTSPRLPVLFGVRDSGFYGKGHVFHPNRQETRYHRNSAYAITLGSKGQRRGHPRLAEFQKGEVSPSSPSTASVSSTVFRRHAGSRRSGPYHACARRHPCSRDNIAPRSSFHCRHQRSTCSSDRKSSMVFQLKTMSSHQ